MFSASHFLGPLNAIESRIFRGLADNFFFFFVDYESIHSFKVANTPKALFYS